MSIRKKRPCGLHYVRKSKISPYFIGYRRELKPISYYRCPFRLCCSLLGGCLPPAEGVPPGVFHGFMGSRPPAVRSISATGARPVVTLCAEDCDSLDGSALEGCGLQMQPAASSQSGASVCQSSQSLAQSSIVPVRGSS